MKSLLFALVAGCLLQMGLAGCYGPRGDAADITAVRVRMAVYYQGFGEGADNDFEITDYPRSRKALTRRLNSNRFLPFAPEAERQKTKKGKKRAR